MKKLLQAQENRKLKIALPAGSLKEATIDLFANAGFNIRVSERSYAPMIDDADIECVMMRAQEIPMYVEQGVVDAGLTGKDWISERQAKVREVAELVYSKAAFTPVRLVLAVPNNSPINSVKDLKGKRIATELVGVTKRYLAKKGVRAQVEFSWGATESKPPKLADAIAELTDTGRSLAANNLRIIATIMESTTRLIANKSSWRDTWKKQKLEDMALLLTSALAAQGMVGLKLNVPKLGLKKILAVLPALNTPTIAHLTDPKWLAVEVVIAETVVRTLIPELKRRGAEGIIEYPLNKMIV